MSSLGGLPSTSDRRRSLHSDSAASVTDDSCFSNQVALESPEAKSFMATLITGAPAFTPERAAAFLFDNFVPFTTIKPQPAGFAEYELLESHPRTGEAMTLPWALKRLGLPEMGYSVRRGAGERSRRTKADQGPCGELGPWTPSQPLAA